MQDKFIGKTCFKLYLLFKLIEVMLVINVVDGTAEVLQGLHPLCETIEVVATIDVIHRTGQVLQLVNILLDLSKAMCGVNIVDCGSV